MMVERVLVYNARKHIHKLTRVVNLPYLVSRMHQNQAELHNNKTCLKAGDLPRNSSLDPTLLIS